MQCPNCGSGLTSLDLAIRRCPQCRLGLGGGGGQGSAPASPSAGGQRPAPPSLGWVPARSVDSGSDATPSLPAVAEQGDEGELSLLSIVLRDLAVGV